MEIATKNSEADPVAVLGTFLGQFGIEVGNRPRLAVGDAFHYTRLFVAIVGASAKARKGTSAKPVEKLFRFYKELPDRIPGIMKPYKIARCTPGPLSTGEGIIDAVRDERKEWNAKESAYVVADPGISDKRLFVLDEELASALNCTKREGNTLSSIVRCLYDSGSIEPLTKSSKLKTTNAHIGICTHITNAELNKKLTETEALNGFGNRFLWVCARRNGKV